MKKLVIFLFSALLIGSCQSNSQKKSEKDSYEANPTIEVSASKDIPYSVAKNYFAKNNIEGLVEKHITTAAQFDSLFGMATVMGNSGKPTPIDFEKQSVIAIIYPATNSADALKPISLEKLNNGDLCFTYHLDKGEKMSYSIHPSLILVIDKSYNSSVIFKK